MVIEVLKVLSLWLGSCVFELIKLLSHDESGPTIKRQLAKASTSVHMNYRATCRARSRAWLDLIAEAKLLQCDLLLRLQKESHELEAIFSASSGTARGNNR